LEKVEVVRSVEKKIKNGDYKGALGEITKCLELCPNFTTAKVLKSECLLKLGNYEESLALANEVLFSAPDNIKARKIAVDANLELGNISEAKSHVDFLTFLLPANHPYLEEIKQKISEKESLVSRISGEESFEIERNEVADKTELEKEIPDKIDEDEFEKKSESADKDDKEKEILAEKSETESEKSEISENTDVFENVQVKDETEKNQPSFHSEDTIIEESDSGEFVINESEIESSESKEEIVDEEIETVNKEEIITGVLPEQISTVTLPDKREEPEIKTRTLALIYERQGMLEEALEILENLYEKNNDYELLTDIERIKAKLKGGEKSEYVMKKIKKLQDWLERIKWHSSA